MSLIFLRVGLSFCPWFHMRLVLLLCRCIQPELLWPEHDLRFLCRIQPMVLWPSPDFRFPPRIAVHILLVCVSQHRWLNVVSHLLAIHIMRQREETRSDRPVQCTCINNTDTVGEPWTVPQFNLSSIWACYLVIIFHIVNMRYWPSHSYASHYMISGDVLYNEWEGAFVLRWGKRLKGTLQSQA